MQKCTHRQGYILDLVISHEDDDLVRDVSVSSMLSDQFFVNIEVSYRVKYCLYADEI